VRAALGLAAGRMRSTRAAAVMRSGGRSTMASPGAEASPMSGSSRTLRRGANGRRLNVSDMDNGNSRP
jgi:hypothetical protein